MLAGMAKRPIIFALANPDPEITYDEAKRAVPDAIVATGRSDYPNQVNNVLGFPFVFRGALDCRAKKITEEMKIAAVHAIAALAREDVPDNVLQAYGVDRLEFGPDYLIPKPFDARVLLWVAPAVAEAAKASGVARQPIQDMAAYRDRLERMSERSKEIIRPLMNRASRAPTRIVFPDGAHPKILRAARILVDEGICKPVLIGEEWRIVNRADQHGITLDGIEICEVKRGPTFDKYAQELWALRQRKGLTLDAARQQLHNYTTYGMMMVRSGDAAGLVGGLAQSYAATIRPALQVLGKDPRVRVLSGVYVMLFKDRRFYFGDCTVNKHPDARTLAQIALNTAWVARSLGDVPRVAVLSYSDFGEDREDDVVRRSRDAVEILKRVVPNVEVDGEMQADTAVNVEMATNDFPFSRVAGKANVLVFPDLASGNVAYKLLRELGGATALGPIIVGLKRPVNVLPLGATVTDVVNVAAITVNQFLDLERDGPTFSWSQVSRSAARMSKGIPGRVEAPPPIPTVRVIATLLSPPGRDQHGLVIPDAVFARGVGQFRQTLPALGWTDAARRGRTVDNATHMVESVEPDHKGRYRLQIRVLDTQDGRILDGLIDADIVRPIVGKANVLCEPGTTIATRLDVESIDFQLDPHR
jgi:malate dehydrogenase (oxaloacetate-decarboxylating)(NADP+)